MRENRGVKDINELSPARLSSKTPRNYNVYLLLCIYGQTINNPINPFKFVLCDVSIVIQYVYDG